MDEKQNYVYLKLVNDEKCRFPLDMGGLVFGLHGSWHIVDAAKAKLLKASNPNQLVYCDIDGNPTEEIPKAIVQKPSANEVKVAALAEAVKESAEQREAVATETVADKDVLDVEVPTSKKKQHGRRR